MDQVFLRTERATISPQTSKPEIQRSSVGIRPFPNDNQVLRAAKAVSVGLEPPPVRGKRGCGRSRLRAVRGTDIASVRPQARHPEVVSF